MRAIQATWSLACGLAALLAAPPAEAQAPAGGVVERDVVDLAPARGTRIERIDIDNRLGDVKIEGHDREAISIIAVKRARDQETLERLKVSLVPDPGGAVMVSTALLAGPEARPIPAGSVRIDLIVKAPRSAQVQAQVWKGRIAVSGVENGAQLVSDDGDIAVREVTGSVSTHSGHGRQTFARVFGAIDARALEGDLDLDVVRGDRVDAVVQEGQVVGRHVRVRELSVLVTRGSISIEGEAVAGGRYRFASYWGSVQVKLGGKAPLHVRAHSREGRVSLPRRFRRLTSQDGAVIGTLGVGGTPADLDLRTRVGSITLAEF